MLSLIELVVGEECIGGLMVGKIVWGIQDIRDIINSINLTNRGCGISKRMRRTRVNMIAINRSHTLRMWMTVSSMGVKKNHGRKYTVTVIAVNNWVCSLMVISPVLSEEICA